MNHCGKICYQTEQAAGVGLESSRVWLRDKESPGRTARLSVYRCEDCRAWHVGHRTPRDEARA